MSLTGRQAFKFAFIARCIEEGHATPEAVHDRVKQAIDELENSPAATLQQKAAGFTDLVTTPLGWMIPVLAAAPPAIGAGLGYAAARAGDVDDVDVEEMRRQEIIEELRRQAKKLRRQRGLSDYRTTIQPFARAG